MLYGRYSRPPLTYAVCQPRAAVGASGGGGDGRALAAPVGPSAGGHSAAAGSTCSSLVGGNLITPCCTFHVPLISSVLIPMHDSLNKTIPLFSTRVTAVSALCTHSMGGARCKQDVMGDCRGGA